MTERSEGAADKVGVAAKRPTFLAELHRRNVIRMAGLYLVGAWLIVQVAGTVLPMFAVPDWVARAVVIVLALGFAPVLVFAWVFEWTPEGFKRDTEVPIEQSIAPETARRLDRLTLAGLVAVAALVAADRYWPRTAPEAVDTTVAASTPRVAAEASEAVANDTDEARNAPVSGEAAQKSIAVLAFADMSPDQDNEYFSDGISEEILNALAKIEDLKVAGRTSSFYFKGRNESLKKIGEELGVAHVLEGSVRRQGEKVRITAQLIQVRDGFHLWSDTYDGDLKDVFELQERIARSITNELKVVLQGSQAERLVRAGTANTEAYALYLQATAVFNRRDGAHFPDAIAALQEAIRLDPQYARAHARLAALYVTLPVYSDANVQAAHDQVVKYAQSASALDPTLAEPYAALGFVRGMSPGHFIEQHEALEHALALDADDVTANFWFGLALIKTGYGERGTVLVDRALALDPMLPNALRWRAIMHLYAGELERAELLMKRARDVGLQLADRELAEVAHARGDAAAATKLWADGTRSVLFGMPPDSPEVIAGGIYGDAAARARAVALIDTFLVAPHDSIPGMLPPALVRLGEPGRALAVMRMPTTNNIDFLALLWSPQGYAMRALPEFDAFLRDYGFIDLWDKYGAPDGCQREGPGDYVCP